MTTFTNKRGFIPEYNITVGLKFLPSSLKTEEDLINYNWQLEHLRYIDIDNITVYGEDRDVRYFKARISEEYEPKLYGEWKTFYPIDYCMVLSEDMPLYQKIKEKFIITLDFSKLLDKLKRELNRTRDHQKWSEEHIGYNHGMLYLNDISFYKSFCDFIEVANNCRITKEDKNFKFIKQEELDNLDVDKLLYSFDKCKYNMFNYDDLYSFFEEFVNEKYRK